MVVVAIGAFACGGHYNLLQQQRSLFRNHQVAHNGLWLQEARGDGNVQKPSGLQTAADDNLSDIFQSDSPYGTFQNVYQLLKDQYVEGIPSDTPLAYGAAEALLGSLDEPNSRFIEPAERRALDDQDNGVYQGAGILFTVRKQTDSDLVIRKITTVDVVPGSPAEKAGIVTGDVVTEIDHHWIIAYDPIQADAKLFKKLAKDEVGLEKEYTSIENKIKNGISLAKAQAQLNAPDTAPLVLTVERAGEPKPLTFSLDVSQPTRSDSATWKTLPDGSGYIRILSFNNNTVAQFDKALASLASASGIVLDLRDCPGGQLTPALAIANSMAPGTELGRIVVRDNRAKNVDPTMGFGTKVQPLKSTPNTPVLKNSYHGKIVVLINNATANTAELLAAFLHDRVGARMAGTSTFGDATAQTLFPMSDGSAFTLTTGVLQTASGKSFNLAGIVPDVPVADSAIRRDGDQAVAKAEALLSLPPLKVEASRPAEPPTLSL